MEKNIKVFAGIVLADLSIAAYSLWRNAALLTVMVICVCASVAYTGFDLVKRRK